MKARTLLALAALAGFTPQLRAQTFHDLWIHCTPGALRSCAHTEIGFASVEDPQLGPITLLLVRLSNLQGQPGFESAPRGFSSMWIRGFEGTPDPRFSRWAFDANHQASEGNASIGAFLGADDLNSEVTPDGRFSAQWNLDASTLLFGCDDPPPAYFETVIPFSFLGIDRTCGGSITYALRLGGSFRMAGQPPSISYDWRAWQDASDNSAFGTHTSCTTGVDCAMVTPEPATLLLLATGLAGIGGLAAVRRRRVRLSA